MKTTGRNDPCPCGSGKNIKIAAFENITPLEALNIQ